LLPIYSFVFLRKKELISNRKLHIEGIKSEFKSEQIINNKDLFDFYKTADPDIKETTVNWRIYMLVQAGILKRIGRGKFILGEEKRFIPEILPQIKTISSKLQKNFPYLNNCIWSTSSINEFMIHQPGRFYLLVEVEKDAAESVFFLMKEKKYVVFLDPAKEMLYRYLPDEKNTWIVKSLVSEAPTQIVSGIYTTTIEKMLVDIFCDKIIFDAQQGSEMEVIFKAAYNKYTINEDKMFRYADRRGKKNEMIAYISSIPKLRQ